MNNIINYIEDIYQNDGTLEFSQYGTAIRILKNTEDTDYLEAFKTHIREADSRYSMSQLKDALKGIIYNLVDSPYEAFIDLFESAVESCRDKMNQLPETIEDLRILKPSQWDEFRSTLTGVKQVIATIIWNTGMKGSDLLRIKNLDGLLKGEIVIIGEGMTKARTLTSNDNFGLNKDEASEVIEVIKSVVADSNSLGKVAHDKLGQYLYGWEYTPTQLCTSHAIRRLNEGYSYSEVADEQGVRKGTLEQRVKKYLKANQ